MSVITITKENFTAEVLESKDPVLLDFWATWCGPCRMVAPHLEAIAQDHPEITVGKIDIDQEMELAVRFGIVSIPTLIVMEGGEVKAKSIGYMPKAEIEKLLEK